MVWYGSMVWYGMVWYGMVWYGMVWYGMEYKVVIFLYRDLIIKYAFPLSNDRGTNSIVNASDQDIEKNTDSIASFI